MKRAVVLTVLLLAMAPAMPALADPTDDAAKARYVEGTRLYNKRKYEEARVAFLQAAALKKRPATTMMLAECALKLGHWLDAAKGFDAFVAEAGAATMNSKLKDLVENGRREARSHLGRLRFDVPEGAELVVDGQRLEGTEPIDVVSGHHTVLVTQKDEKKTVEVDAPAGTTTNVHPTFVPKALIPTEGTRTHPVSPPPPPPSAVDESPSILAPPRTMWPVYVGGAVGIGGLMTAAIFGGIAANARHGIDVSNQTIARNAKSGASCADPATFDDPAKGQTIADFSGVCHTIARNRNVSNDDQGVFQGSLVIGIVGMVGALTWFFVAPKERSTPDMTTLLVPWMGPTGAGASAQGRF